MVKEKKERWTTLTATARGHMRIKKGNRITLQENEYTGLQAYTAPHKGFRVYVKGQYSNSIKSSEKTFYASKLAYHGARIGVALGTFTFLVGLFLAIWKSPEFVLAAIFAPMLVTGATIGLTNDDSSYEFPSTACSTLEDAMSEAIAYQEILTNEVQQSLEYNDYLKNLAEVGTTKVIEGSE